MDDPAASVSGGPGAPEPPGEVPGDRTLANPFLVLGLGTAATLREVEREGQKLIGMLELGLEAAGAYGTPFGPRPRTIELVRRAMAELRDPQRRLVHELWLGEGIPAGRPAPPSPSTAWKGARAAFAWGHR